VLPDDYVLVTIDVGDLAVEDVAFLPADQRAFGGTWIREQRTPLLRCRPSSCRKTKMFSESVIRQPEAPDRGKAPV
jgi:hypothetical protein